MQLMRKYFTSTILFIILSIIFSFSTQAQDDSTTKKREFSNSIILSGTDYYFSGEFRRFGTLLFWKDDQIGVYFERKIFRNFKIQIGYNEWNNVFYNRNELKQFLVLFNNDTLKVGNPLILGKFKMTDLLITYNYKIHKKHNLKIGIGISYTWGLNDYISAIIYNPDPPYDGLIFTSSKKVYEWGVIPMVGYDYVFLKDRVIFGADFRYRKYYGVYQNTFEYGFHLGFNF